VSTDEHGVTLLGESVRFSACSFSLPGGEDDVSVASLGETTSNADLLGCEEKFGYISANDVFGYDDSDEPFEYISDVLGYISDALLYRSECFEYKSELFGYKSDVLGYKSELFGYKSELLGYNSADDLE
jgi:hypothetical protein